MKLRKLLLCLLLVTALTACSKGTPEMVLPNETPALPTEATVEETLPPPPYLPIPVIEWAIPEADTTRQEANIERNEVLMTSPKGDTLYRTEYVYDQNDALMEIRTLTFDEESRPVLAVIEKKDAEENTIQQQSFLYRADGSVDSGDHVVCNSHGQEFLRWEYLCHEDGSVQAEYYYQFEYGENHKLSRKLFSKTLEGILLFIQQEDYDSAGKLTGQTFWYFHEDGTLKEWSAQEQTADGAILKKHKVAFNEAGTAMLETMDVYDPSGAKLEMKEYRCYASGAVHLDFYERYAADGTILAQSKAQYRENGDLYFLHKEAHTEQGEEIFYHHEQFFDSGELEHKQLKEYYENGQLRFWEYLSYHTPGVPASSSYTEYDENGKLLKKDVTEYDENGKMTYICLYPAEDAPEMMRIEKHTSYPNGNPEYIWECFCDPRENLMDGKQERYYESGQPWSIKEASFDEATRTTTRSETHYKEDGTVDCAWQRVEAFDKDWRYLSYESTTFDSNLQATYHEVYHYSYGENSLTITSVTDDGSGNILFNNSSEYTYDEQGHIIHEDRILRNPDGSFQSRMEFLYNYSETGVQTGNTTIQYDEVGQVLYCYMEEYNDAGLLYRRIIQTEDDTQFEDYTYDENGRLQVLSVTFFPTTEDGSTMIEYRKTTYTYHANGAKQSETTQTWTSKDEEKAAPDTPREQLGKTTVVYYDENGNRI